MAQIKRMEIGLNERKKNLHHVYWFDAYKIAVICAFFYLTTLLPRYCVIANYCMFLSPQCVWDFVNGTLWVRK